MAITVASLVAKLDYDDSEFQRGISGSESRLSSFGGLAGKAIGLGVGAIAAGVGAVAASTMKMQDVLTPVMTLTGRSSEQFKDMSKAIDDVVSSSPKSADEIGNAAYMILSAGITDTAKAQQTLVDSNSLALAGLGSVPQATDLITSAMNSWKDSNLSSSDSAKILFGTIAAGKTTTADLAQGFGSIAPLAASLGVDFKSLMAATAALTATGMPASVAYSGLKAAFANILKPTADAEKAAKSIGVEFSASALKTKGLAGFLQEIGQKAGGSTQTLTDLFGSVEAGNAVLALTGSQAQAFADNFGIIDEKGKNLNQTAKEVSETFSNRLKIMKNNAMVHLSEIGNKGLDWLSAKWKDWGPGIKQAVDYAKNVISDAALGIAAGFRGLDVDPERANGITQFFWKVGQFAQSAKQTLVMVFGEIKGGFLAFVAAFKAGDGDITSVGFPGFMEQVGFKVREVWNWIQTNWPVIKQTFLDVFHAVADWIQQELPGILATFKQEFETARDIVIQVVEKVKEYWPQISAVVQGVADAILPILSFMVAMWEGTIQLISNAWNDWGTHILDVVMWVFGFITPSIVASLEIIRGIFEFFTALIQGNWGEAWNALTGIFQSWWGGFLGIFQNAWEVLRGVVSTLYGIGSDIIHGLINGISDAIGGIASVIASIPQNIWAYMNNAGSWLWSTGWNLIQGLIGGIRDAAAGAASAAVSVVKNAISSAWHAITPGSPSKQGRAIGQNFGQGIIAGMEDTHDLVGRTGSKLGSGMIRGASGTVNNFGGPGNVTINMPPGSNGNDVVRALRDWQKRNGTLPLSVSGRTA